MPAPNLRLVGSDPDHVVHGEDGSVTIHAPTADLTANALVASGKTHGLLVPPDRAAEYEDGAPRCVRCKGGDIVLLIDFPGQTGHPLAFCRDCLTKRPPGNPVRVDMEMLG